MLESERLDEVRRGSRTGARVCIPGPEIVARPAALLLELSGATLADVVEARAGIEPAAVRLLAETGTDQAFDELTRLIESLPAAREDGALAQAAAHFHRRLVELSGSPTLAMVAGMLHEITERHIRASIRTNVGHTVPRSQYAKLLRSLARLVEIAKAGDAEDAERHWRIHMEKTSALLLLGLEDVRVRDIMD